MKFNFAHIRERSTSGGSIDFAVFDARSTSGSSTDNAQVLADLTSRAANTPGNAHRAAERQRDGLTLREHEVLELVAQGIDNRGIGERLHMAEKTVRNNISIILDKLGVHTRAKAIVKAREAGFGQKSVL